MRPETLPAVAPLEPTTPIRPSEAIRLGCLIAPRQLFNNYWNDRRTAACAIGAAALGWGIDYFDAEYRMQQGLSEGVPCPGCDEFHHGYPSILNDDHRWSRERIADWLAGLGL